MINENDKDFRAVRRELKELLKGAYKELVYAAAGDRAARVVRENAAVRIVLERDFPRRPVRFAWYPSYSAYIGDKLVVQQGCGLEDFIRRTAKAVVTRQRAGEAI